MEVLGHGHAQTERQLRLPRTDHIEALRNIDAETKVPIPPQRDIQLPVEVQGKDIDPSEIDIDIQQGVAHLQAVLDVLIILRIYIHDDVIDVDRSIVSAVFQYCPEGAIKRLLQQFGRGLSVKGPVERRAHFAKQGVAQSLHEVHSIDELIANQRQISVADKRFERFGGHIELALQAVEDRRRVTENLNDIHAAEETVEIRSADSHRTRL